ncbi:MAG: outer membrane beta-barrel protein [Gemmatimonadaceae bacterium]
MLKIVMKAGLAASALVTLPAIALHAQLPAGIAISVAVGPAIPVGDLKDAGSETGFNILGALQFPISGVPLTPRVDVLWMQLGISGNGGDTRMLGLVGNVVYPLDIARLGIYVLAGIGGYNITVADNDATTYSGFNGGAGLELELGGVTMFGEARLHYILSPGPDPMLVPVSFGVRF